jgi:hypothetical protein
MKGDVMKIKQLVDPIKEQLVRELMRQWLANHWEHCGNHVPPWPHTGKCHWPIPEMVLSLVAREELEALLAELYHESV